MANEKHDPFRGDLTYAELSELMNGKTLDEILALREPSQQPPIAETDSPATASESQAATKKFKAVDTMVAPKPQVDPTAKLTEFKRQNTERPIEVHEVSDPFVRPEATPAPDIFEQAAREHLVNGPISESVSDPVFTQSEEPTFVAGHLDPATGATGMIEVPKVLEMANQPALAEMSKADPGVEGVEEDSNARMLRGSMWMTIGSIASRLLGALYIIPWVAMIGNAYFNQANSLYAQGYQIYGVALMIATAGLPNVLARLVAEYAAQREYGHVRQVFRHSLVLGGFMGLLAGGGLYLFAGPLSQGDPNVVAVIQSLAAAVLIIPILAMLRGYMQGFELMGPSALSQFIEQVVRVIYMLAMTYIIMSQDSTAWVAATVQSTFAAFWGALAGILVLVAVMIKRRAFFEAKFAEGKVSEPIQANQLMLRMVRQSIPVILAGSAIALVQVIDQYTFFDIMRKMTSFSDTAVTTMYSQFAFNSNKLVMLVVSLAVGMSETALPMLARAREIGDRENISHQIQYAFKLLLFVMVPATLGMAAVARPLYLFFYNTNDLVHGTLVLQFASYTAIVLGGYMVILAIFQGLNQLRYTIRLLFLILVLKFVLQIPMTLWLAGLGPLMSTALAFMIGMYFALQRLTKQYDIDWGGDFTYTLMLILAWSLVVFAVAWPITVGLSSVLSTHKLAQLAILVIAGGAGALVYTLATLKTSLGTDIFGPKLAKIAAKLPF